MVPTLYETAGGAGIQSFGLMMLLAYLAAFGMVHWRSVRIGVELDRLMGALIAAGVGGLLGARLLYIIAIEPGSFFAWGFAAYGGYLGGLLGLLIVAKVMALSGWKLADAAAPAVLVTMSIGRIGCFLAGCCSGGEMRGASLVPLLPEGLLHGQVYLASAFPYVACRFDPGAVVYPTQLMEAVLLWLLALALASRWRSRRFDGQIAAAALVAEPPIRMFVESFRPQTNDVALTGLSAVQPLGLLAMVVGAGILVVRRNSGVSPEIPMDVDHGLEVARS